MGAMNQAATRVIRELGLEPHPEGGFYREIFRSAYDVLPSDTKRPLRAAMTLIYFLLPAGAKSKWHRVSSDEAWHHLDGAPLELFEMRKESVTTMRLGKDIAGGEVFQHVIPAGVFQAAWTMGDYTLVGCTVAPGFDFQDFEMPKKSVLLELFPAHAMWIEALG